MQKEQTSQCSARRPDGATAREASQTGLRSVLKEAVSSRLFLMTTLGAASGQIPAMAAEGLLASPTVAFTVGLTVVAGVGAFLAAIDEARLGDERGRRVFTITALLSILANVAAAGVGLAFSQIASVEHMRYFIALALGVIAVEIASKESITLPQGVPVPSALVAVGVVVEALL